MGCIVVNRKIEPHVMKGYMESAVIDALLLFVLLTVDGDVRKSLWPAVWSSWGSADGPCRSSCPTAPKQSSHVKQPAPIFWRRKGICECAEHGEWYFVPRLIESDVISLWLKSFCFTCLFAAVRISKSNYLWADKTRCGNTNTHETWCFYTISFPLFIHS